MPTPGAVSTANNIPDGKITGGSGTVSDPGWISPKTSSVLAAASTIVAKPPFVVDIPVAIVSKPGSLTSASKITALTSATTSKLSFADVLQDVNNIANLSPIKPAGLSSALSNLNTVGFAGSQGLSEIGSLQKADLSSLSGALGAVNTAKGLLQQAAGLVNNITGANVGANSLIGGSNSAPLGSTANITPPSSGGSVISGNIGSQNGVIAGVANIVPSITTLTLPDLISSTPGTIINPPPITGTTPPS